MSFFQFTLIDVFTDTPLRGNPLAVVHAADALSEATMQDFARWMNLSETAFLMSPTDAAADYRVRIYTPGCELPFAGHPTLGACHAWLQAGGCARSANVVQQCGIGLVRIRRDGERLAFAAPALRSAPVDGELLASVCAALGLTAGQVRQSCWLDNGPRWLALLLDDAQTVLSLAPDHVALKSLAPIGVIGPHPAGAACQFEVRGFAASLGIDEDPVTGSLNASLAQWLMAQGLAPPRYVASQGARLGRGGRVHLLQRDGHLWVGGDCVSCVRGEMQL